MAIYISSGARIKGHISVSSNYLVDILKSFPGNCMKCTIYVNNYKKSVGHFPSFSNYGIYPGKIVEID